MLSIGQPLKAGITRHLSVHYSFTNDKCGTRGEPELTRCQTTANCQTVLPGNWHHKNYQKHMTSSQNSETRSVVWDRRNPEQCRSRDLVKVTWLSARLEMKSDEVAVAAAVSDILTVGMY
jgi:hypothetical protein